MPKINYEKQPFRLCRWNKKLKIPTDSNQLRRPSKGKEYWCEDRDDYANEEMCMHCFCNDLYEICDECKKDFLKTEVKRIFHSDRERIVFVCNDCYNNEEMVK